MCYEGYGGLPSTKSLLREESGLIMGKKGQRGCDRKGSSQGGWR